jgi:DNA polymerase III epsilon subunit-like protein
MTQNWRTPLNVLDTETGGLEAQTHALCSVGIVNDSTGEELYVLVKPADGLVMTAKALQVNGFSAEKLAAEGKSEADVAAEISKFLRANPGIIAGQNPAFDLQFILALEKRTGVRIDTGYRVVELQTLALAAHWCGSISLPIAYGQPTANLDNICACLGLSRTSAKHGALEDAKLTARAIDALMRKFSGACSGGDTAKQAVDVVSPQDKP